VKVPVVPLVADYAAWTSNFEKIAAGEATDEYAVDPLTNMVTSGSDGIAELTLVCGAEATAPAVSCAVLALFDELNLSYVWPVRCREGLSLGDLRPYGGALIVRNGGTPVVVETDMPHDLPYGLMDILGHTRAWPLVASQAASTGEVNLVAFAAACVVAVRPVADSPNNAWEIVVQPAVLVSSQAVATADTNPNPWIAKLELTQ
jgi:hypothetical protein